MVDLNCLAAFSPLTRAWFEATFDAPTAAQDQGWPAIARGEHTLILAPTGSGKTLAAFLWAIDRLMTSEPSADEGPRRCRVLYVSPLKALTYDVEKNLRSPLAGIALEADRARQPAPRVSVATRTGDTPQSDRRDMAKNPPDKAALLKARVVKSGEPEFADLDAKYLAGCKNPLVKSALPKTK